VALTVYSAAVPVEPALTDNLMYFHNNAQRHIPSPWRVNYNGCVVTEMAAYIVLPGRVANDGGGLGQKIAKRGGKQRRTASPWRIVVSFV